MKFLLILTVFIMGIFMINNANALPQPIIDIPMNRTLNNYGAVSNTVIPSQSTNYQSIVNNAGINFNTGYYLQLADQSQYNIAKTDPITMQFALKDTYASPLIIARSSVNYVQGDSLEMYNGQMLWNMIDTWGSDQVTVGTYPYMFNDNKLHFVTVTKSSGNPFNLCIYDNSTQINCVTGSISGTISNTNPIYIGAGAGDSRQVQGQMALFKMYNVEFSQNDVTNSFNAIFHPVAPQPTGSLSDSLSISDSIQLQYNHLPTNRTVSLSDQTSFVDSVTSKLPTANCSISTSTLSYNVTSFRGYYSACNMKTGIIDYSDTDEGNAINYAISHLDSSRTSFETVNISANSTLFIHAILVENYTHLHFNNVYLNMGNRIFHNFYDAVFLGFPHPPHGQHDIIIDGKATLDCGNIDRYNSVISGTYLVNGDGDASGYNISASGLHITNCDHVGFYEKGWRNSHIFNIETDHIISYGSAVGIGTAIFGGHNVLVENMTSHDNCGNLGNGYQIEANDEVISGVDYQSNTSYKNISAYNNCGESFVTSNIGTGNSLTAFHFTNSTVGVDIGSGQPMSVSYGEVGNFKTYGTIMSNYGSTVLSSHYWNDYNFKGGKAGILFNGNTGFASNTNTFSNIPIGVDVATSGVTLTGNCFINVPQQYKVEAGSPQPTVSGNVC